MPRYPSSSSSVFDPPWPAGIGRSIEIGKDGLVLGDRALANLRLVFAGLPRLDDPADADRLRLAEYRLDQGLSPGQLIAELGLGSLPSTFVKYDPAQPRVPAGSGRESGRWGPGSGSLALVKPLIPSFLADATPETVSALVRFAARFSVPTAVLGALIIPTPNSGGVTDGVLPDAPDIGFRKDDPAGLLRLTKKGADGSDIVVVAQNQRGLYVDLRTGQSIGRDLGGQLYLDVDAVQDSIEDAAPDAGEGEPEARPKAASEEPKLCPAPTPDIGHGSSPAAKDYEDDVHARVNPIAPIPREFGVKVFNPVTGQYVYFDDCFRYAGDLVDGDMKSGDLVDAKGPGYEFLYAQDWSTTMQQNVKRAEKELKAADARGVGLKWYFAEKGAADRTREEFADSDLRRIVIGYMPPRRRR